MQKKTIDGYKKIDPITITIDKYKDIFGSSDASSQTLRDEIVKNGNTFSLTDIMIKKHDEKSFEFYGLHKIQKKEDKEKALKIANDRKSHYYSILKHLEEDKL